MKLKNILEPEGQVFLNKKTNLFWKHEPWTLLPIMVKWIKYLKANHLIIVAAEMIAKTSGSGILVLTRD